MQQYQTFPVFRTFKYQVQWLATVLQYSFPVLCSCLFLTLSSTKNLPVHQILNPHLCRLHNSMNYEWITLCSTPWHCTTCFFFTLFFQYINILVWYTGSTSNYSTITQSITLLCTISLEAKGANWMLIWLVVKPFCLWIGLNIFIDLQTRKKT